MIKVIQVGYGYWGESWVQYLRDDPNFELTALVVRTEETLAKAKEKWLCLTRRASLIMTRRLNLMPTL